MRRVGKENWGLKVLSVLLAVVLWIYVSNEQNPVQDQELKAVSVDVRGLAKNMAVMEYPGAVTVRVQSDRNAISELNLKAVRAFVDLTGARPGKNTVPVQVEKPEGVKVIDLRPGEVTVTLEALADKQVPVALRTSGAPNRGYKVLGVKAKPDQVILRGPKSILDRVDFASAGVVVGGREKSFSETVPLKVADDAGNFLEERVVKRTPAVVDLLVSIGPDKPSRTVKAVPSVTGEPAAGYTVTMTVVDPPELVITGDAEVIDGLTQVSTAPVDINGATKDIYMDSAPVLPPGVRSNRPALKVLVKIGRE